MNELLEIAFTVLGAAVTCAVTALCNWLIRLIREKIGGEAARRTAETAVRAVAASVAATAQTYVDELKKEGKFDEDARKTAFAKAKETALAMLGDSVKKTLEEIHGNLDAYIGAEIESAVRASKSPAV